MRKDMHRGADWRPRVGDEWKVGPTEIAIVAIKDVPAPGGRNQIEATLEVRSGADVETVTFQAHPVGYGRAWQNQLRKAALRRGWPFDLKEKPKS